MSARTRYGRANIRGNQINRGAPSGAGLADGGRAVLFSAPVPSGCTVTAVRSTATAFDREADDLRMLHLREDPTPSAVFGPAMHAGVDRVPAADTCRPAALLAALLGHGYDRVQPSQIG